MRLDATAKGTIVTYSSKALGVNLIISASGVEKWFTVEDVEGAQMDVALDGTLLAFVKPAKVNGELTILSSSPALPQLAQIVQQQYNSNIIFSGTLTLTSLSGLWTQTYSDFIWTSAFKGLELAQRVQDVPFKFSAGIPQTFSLANLAALASAGLNS